MAPSKTSRAALRRSVLLVSGLGIPPMTLDLMICISGVPVPGIATFRAASARQVFVGNSELVGLAGADHEMAFPAVPDLAGDRVFEITVTEPFHHDGFQMHERFRQLAVMRTSGRENRSLMHCAAAPSCPSWLRRTAALGPSR